MRCQSPKNYMFKLWGKWIFLYIIIFSGKNMWNQNFNGVYRWILTKVKKILVHREHWTEGLIESRGSPCWAGQWYVKWRPGSYNRDITVMHSGHTRINDLTAGNGYTHVSNLTAALSQSGAHNLTAEKLPSGYTRVGNWLLDYQFLVHIIWLLENCRMDVPVGVIWLLDYHSLVQIIWLLKNCPVNILVWVIWLLHYHFDCWKTAQWMYSCE